MAYGKKGFYMSSYQEERSKWGWDAVQQALKELQAQNISSETLITESQSNICIIKLI